MSLGIVLRAHSDARIYIEDVTIVSPTNYFNFTPLLAGCAVGTLEFRSAVEPVRRPLDVLTRNFTTDLAVAPMQVRRYTPRVVSV